MVVVTAALFSESMYTLEEKTVLNDYATTT
jgi:hypothetical protein